MVNAPEELPVGAVGEDVLGAGVAADDAAELVAAGTVLGGVAWVRFGDDPQASRIAPMHTRPGDATNQGRFTVVS